jgi:DNA-binding PadR family transcriptional regulator
MGTPVPPQPYIMKYLPLTETTFYILFSLAPHPNHGYAIMKEVLSLSDGRIDLSAGTLYGALKRLLDEKWIERIEEDPAPSETGRLRKAYALTDLGKRILDAEVLRLRALVKVARPYIVEP